MTAFERPRTYGRSSANANPFAPETLTYGQLLRDKKSGTLGTYVGIRVVKNRKSVPTLFFKVRWLSRDACYSYIRSTDVEGVETPRGKRYRTYKHSS